jgi:hypothetical protein
MSGSELQGLNATDLISSLKNIGVYVVDVETTGLSNKDKMFSAAYTTMDMDSGSPLSTKESFFSVSSVKRPKKIDFKTDADFVTEIENRLARAHSSELFGDAQLQRGSLRDAATAMAENKTITPATFLKGLDQELAGNANGAVVLTHNAQFENNQFNRLQGSSAKYDQAYDSVKRRNGTGNRGLFGANTDISNWSGSEQNRGHSQRIREAHTEYVKATKTSDPTLIRAALGNYATENVNLMNYMVDQIKSVEGKAGSYVNLDTMPVVRALMSFGALNGDVDGKNLMLGGKIEHLSMAWLGLPELHTAGDDTRKQGEISHKLFKELEDYSKDPSRRSPLMQSLNQYINDNNVADSTFKSSVANEFTATSKYKSQTDYVLGVNQWLDKKIASADTPEQKQLAQNVKTQLDTLLTDKPRASKTFIAKEMENWMSKMPSTIVEQQGGKDVVETIANRGKDFLKSHKTKIGIAGALLGASLFIDGSEKGEDKKYNTYDELYNSQYYGSGFADWQNRNNAHRVLY